MLRPATNLDFHKKKRVRRFLYSPLTFIVFALLIALVGWNTWDMYHKFRQTKVSLQKTEEAYAELAAREAFLDTKIDLLSTPAGVEAELRERFGVAKPGEEVIVVLSDEKKEKEVVKEKSFWQRFKDFFRN